MIISEPAFPSYNDAECRIVNKNGLAFFRLFYDEILGRITASKSMRDDIFKRSARILGEEKLTTIRGALARAEAENDEWRICVIERAVLELLFSSEEGTLFIDNELKKLDSQLYGKAHGVHINKYSTSFKTFCEFFFRPDNPRFLDTVAGALQVLSFVDKLGKKRIPFQPFFEEFDPIRSCVRPDVAIRCKQQDVDPRQYSQEFDHRRFARVFLRALPACNQQYKDDAWVFEFIDEARKCPMNRAMLTVFMPDWKLVLRERERKIIEMHRRQRGETEDLGEEVTECRHQKDSCSDMYARWLGDRAEIDELHASEVQLRAYQHELTEKAVQGKNTVIVAPTGSGKTFVAAHIAKQHLDSAEREGRAARVVFVVPKVPLVDQQQRAFNEFFKGRYLIAGLHGGAALGEDENRKEIVLGAHIIVVTPQLLINMLNSVRRSDRIYMCDISLLMLDECHHTTKESAYNVLMDAVHDYKRKKPQVVGLTASLGGSAGAFTSTAVTDYIFMLCASMGATSLSTVQRHKEELDRHVRLPEDEVVRCQKTDKKVAHFYNRVITYMQDVEKDIMPLLAQLTKGATPLFTEKEIMLDKPRDHCLTRYENMVGHLYTNIRRSSRDIPSDSKMKLMAGLELLKIFIRCLLIDVVMPSELALDFLVDAIDSSDLRNHPFFQPYRRAGVNSPLGPLQEYAEHEDIRHKKIVEELSMRVKNQLAATPDSRIIIFVKERATAQRLKKFLNDHRTFEELRKTSKNREIAGFVTSAQSKQKGAAGQTASEQADTLRKFNSGEINIIVATSVVEEGLDVQTCNLIIKYNITGSAVSEVQKRGRARAAGSKSVLLAVHESVEQREMVNRMGEMLMTQAIREIHRISEQEFIQRCDTKRQERENALKQKQKDEDQQKLNNKLCTLHCAVCDSEIGISLDMRTIMGTNFVMCNELIWERIWMEPTTKTKSVGEMTLVLGVAHCKNRASDEDVCNNSLGSVIRYAGVHMLQLSIGSITIADENRDPVDTPKQWKNVKERLFFIREITENDLNQLKDCVPTKVLDELLRSEEKIKEEATRKLRDKRRRFEKEREPRRDWSGDEAEDESDSDSDADDVRQSRESGGKKRYGNVEWSD